MATFTKTISDANMIKILDAFDTVYPGRSEAGLTKAQWFDFKFVEWVKNVERVSRRKTATQSITIDDTLVT